MGKEEIKLFLLTSGNILYIKDCKDATKTLELITKFHKVATSNNQHTKISCVIKH